MKLSYRNVDYDFNPSSLQARGAKHRLAEASRARALGAILTYRGATYTVDPSAQAASASPGAPAGTVLTYRGFSYTVQRVSVPVAAEPAVVNHAKVPALSIQEQARALTMNHHRAMKKRQQVMLVRSAAEVGMSATAASHWERIQETFNPVLQATYDRSHAALS
ncbi:MAG: DUF4278 domain-containing protein [Stenomitos rutilans HA7619-LM2]|jgi:hypothetical protein|nr:DUF4278 domain-containing protein [Stenomitos rutilans HA7619-LM2]